MNETLSKATYLSQVFDSQFVTERLFSELFDFKMDEFVRNADKSNYIAQNSTGGEFGVDEMNLFDKLSNWRSYVSLRREINEIKLFFTLTMLFSQKRRRKND